MSCGIELFLDEKPYSVMNFNFSIVITPDVTKKIGEIAIGYLRSGDEIGSQGNEDLTVWYRDGTKWTINKSWFE